MTSDYDKKRLNIETVLVIDETRESGSDGTTLIFITFLWLSLLFCAVKLTLKCEKDGISNKMIIYIHLKRLWEEVKGNTAVER